MKEEATRLISEHTVFALSLYTIALGAIVAIFIIFFGIRLQRRGFLGRPADDDLLENYLLEIRAQQDQKTLTWLSTWAAAVHSDHLARRNEFWVSYGQLTVAVLLLTMLTVLLLTKTIDPDAGLPILSGIAGFTIAKNTGQNRGSSVPPPPG